jgi:hypothetical protein
MKAAIEAMTRAVMSFEPEDRGAIIKEVLANTGTTLTIEVMCDALINLSIEDLDRFHTKLMAIGTAMLSASMQGKGEA